MVRAGNNPALFGRFLESYRLNSGGIPHELIIIFKGFSGADALEEYRGLLKNIPHKELEIPDRGRDLTAYFLAAAAFSYRYFAFLNSFSVLLDPDWLSKLYKYASGDEVGIAGATGTCESLYTNLFSTPIRFYNRPILRRVRALCFPLRWPYFRALFPSWPNHHVRTNAFMMRREIFLKIRPRAPRGKMAAARFESGKHGLTRQILRMGLKTLVVGRNAVAYDKEHWFESNTFWQGRQENLLVADNQTRLYSEGSPEQRRFLSKQAWGKLSRPETGSAARIDLNTPF